MQFQFIQFSETISNHRCEIPLPMYFGGDEGISFFTPEDAIANMYPTINLCTVEGDIIEGSEGGGRTEIWRFLQGVFKSGASIYSAEKAKQFIAPNELFRICLSGVNGKLFYSNVLQRYESSEGLAHIKYRCLGNDKMLGFPWSDTNATGTFLRQWLPIKLSNPTYKQKDNIYEKINGDKVVLFSQITKEYQCETDYIPEEWHDKLIVALACDEVFIDGERLTKTDDYDPNWENTLKTETGIKCAQASWKMAANVTQRNSI